MLTLLGVTGKAKVLSNLVFVPLRVSCISPGGLENLFERIIEVMHEEMTNIIRFAKQTSPLRLTVKIRYFQCSCIAGVASTINDIGKQLFWHTLLDTIFLVQPYYISP